MEISALDLWLVLKLDTIRTLLGLLAAGFFVLAAVAAVEFIDTGEKNRDGTVKEDVDIKIRPFVLLLAGVGAVFSLIAIVLPGTEHGLIMYGSQYADHILDYVMRLVKGVGGK